MRLWFSVLLVSLLGCEEAKQEALRTPQDFPRHGCSGQLGTLSGLWHLDITLSQRAPFPAALRLTRGKPGMAYNGHPLLVGQDNDQDLILHTEYRGAQTDASTTLYAVTLDLCSRPRPSEVFGHLLSCSIARTPSGGEETCRQGTFRGVQALNLPMESESQGLHLVSEIGGFANEAPQSITTNVALRDGYAYLSRYYDGLRVVDLRKREAPRHVAHLPAPSWNSGEIWNDVKIYKNYALLASSTDGLVVIDVQDPERPQRVASFPGDNKGANVHSIQLEGDRAYLAETSTASLRVVSLKDPKFPTEVGSYVHPDVKRRPEAIPPGQRGSFVHDLSVQGGLAYLNYWGTGFVVVDVSTVPFSKIGQATYDRMTSHASYVTQVGQRRFALHGDEDFGAHLRVYDVTDHNDPARFLSLVGEHSLRPEVSIHNMVAVGSRAYIAHYQDGVRVLELDERGVPKPIGYYNTWHSLRSHPGESFYEGAIGVVVEQENPRRIYVADTHRGLLILDDRIP